MRFILGWLILLPFVGIWWVTLKIIDACMKKSAAFRPLVIIISLIVGGGSLVAGYFIGPMVGWLIMAVGGLVAVGGTWRSLVEPIVQVELEERINKRVKVAELRRGGQELPFLLKEDLKKRERALYDTEKHLQDNAEDVPTLHTLIRLYDKDERYKDKENALVKSIEIQSRLGNPDFWDYKNLGDLYLAALSNAVYRRTGDPWLKNVTLESLGYTLVQAKTLAMEYLEKASKISEQSGRLVEYRKLVNLGYEVAKEQSEAAFNQYIDYIQKLKEEEK